eukprot:3613360-Rhodomonas_salina.8
MSGTEVQYGATRKPRDHYWPLSRCPSQLYCYEMSGTGSAELRFPVLTRLCCYDSSEDPRKAAAKAAREQERGVGCPPRVPSQIHAIPVSVT